MFFWVRSISVEQVTEKTITIQMDKWQFRDIGLLEFLIASWAIFLRFQVAQVTFWLPWETANLNPWTRCVGTTQMSPLWILRRLANVSPFFNSLSNRLRITNYCLRSVSSTKLNLYLTFQKSNQISKSTVKWEQQFEYYVKF